MPALGLFVDATNRTFGVNLDAGPARDSAERRLQLSAIGMETALAFRESLQSLASPGPPNRVAQVGEESRTFDCLERSHPREKLTRRGGNRLG